MAMIPHVTTHLDDNDMNIINMIIDVVNMYSGDQLIEKSYNLLDPEAVVEGSLSSGQLVPNSNFYTSDYMPVIGGQYLQIKPTAGSTSVYDRDGNYITGFSNSDTWPVKLPINAAWVRTSFLKSNLDGKYVYLGLGDKPFKKYGFKFSEGVYDAKFIKELEDMIKVAQQIVIENSQVDEYVNMFDKNNVMMDKSVSQGVIIDSPGFYVYEINVLPGKDLMITPTVGSSSYLNADGEYVSGLTSSSTVPTKVPPEAFKLITSGHQSSLDTKMVYYGTEIIPYQEFGKGGREVTNALSNQLSFNSDGFPEIRTPYDEVSNIEYTFGQLGINEIYHLRRIKTDYFNQLVSSDHISPYRIKAVNNPVADNPVFVTGGNHGSDGSAGGFPTGKPISIETYIDNKKITSGTHHTNSPIVVKVINEACAYNTVNRDTGNRRDVLRETITYTFYPNVHTVTIDMQALEPIEFYGHRGISMQRHNHKQFAYVPTDSNGQVSAGGAFDFHSTSEGSDGDRIVQYNADNHLAVMFLDERFGVGDFELNAVDPRWFMSAGKTYSNTIEQEKYHPVATNEILTLSGGYHFGKALSMPGNGKAYHIIRSGKRVYCADDFYPRSGYISVHPDDVGKEVKIIKNVRYTVDGFTTSKGLKFSKTSGAGTLMFEVI